jgi:hypothetical protein
MDSIMKKVHILLCFISCIGLSSFGQEWQSFDCTAYSSNIWWAYTGPFDRQFKINPYDSSFWFLTGSGATQIKTNGEMVFYNPNNTSVFNSFLQFKDINFTSDAVYVVDRNQGLFRYKDNTWLKISNLTEGVHLASDGDTVWCSRVNQPFLIIESFNIDFGNSNIRKFASNNGEYWGMNSEFNGFLRNFDQDLSFSYYNADTIGYLLDNKNYHFKFSKENSKFYTSGDRGISIATGKVFTDTLTFYSSIGMPLLPILEFELDENDNIWAVFGEMNISPNPQKIGFYDRVLDEWTMIFDENNSPIVFENKPVSIEIDPWGNLWVVNGQYLHVLKQGEDPGWLSTLSNEVQLDYQVYPNPAREKLTIVIPENAEVQSLILSDLFGKLITVNSIEKNQTIELDIAFLQTGCYLLEVTGKNGSKKIIRWIKE